MKKVASLRIIICLAICHFANQAISQQTKPWSLRRLYLNTSASFNSNGPATVQLCMHFNNRWTGYIAHDNANPASKKQPADYRGGTGEFFGLQFTYAPPVDELNLVTAGMGKVLTKPSDKAWVMATGGISFGQYKENQFTPQPEEYFSFFGFFGGTSSNYNTTLKNKTMFGLSTGLEAHANLFRFMGLSTGAKLLLTNTGVYPSFNVGMDIGLMRPNRKNMIKNNG
jgi:hypothetical protein